MSLVPLFFFCYSPCGQPAPREALPAGRWLRTFTLLGWAAPQSPLVHHLQNSFEGEITTPGCCCSWARPPGFYLSTHVLLHLE